MTNLRERNIAAVVILSIITCGLYSFYLVYALGGEIGNEGRKYGENLTTPVSAFLLGLITCQIYTIWYIYRQALVLQKISQGKNYRPLDPAIVLLLTIFAGIGNYINAHTASKLAIESMEN